MGEYVSVEISSHAVSISPASRPTRRSETAWRSNQPFTGLQHARAGNSHRQASNCPHPGGVARGANRSVDDSRPYSTERPETGVSRGAGNLHCGSVGQQMQTIPADRLEALAFAVRIDSERAREMPGTGNPVPAAP